MPGWDSCTSEVKYVRVTGVGVVGRLARVDGVGFDRGTVAGVQHQHVVAQLAGHVEGAAVFGDAQTVGVITDRLVEASYPDDLFGEEVHRHDVGLIGIAEVQSRRIGMTAMPRHRRRAACP